MIFGVDVSKYQGFDVVDGRGFAILNVDDPGFAIKARRCQSLGIPWDVYVWIYPDRNAAAHLRASIEIVRSSNVPGRQPGYWADYEEAGVKPSDTQAFFAEADRQGVQSGLYCYLYLLNREGNPAPDRPLWIAYYPKGNLGPYPEGQEGDAKRFGAKIWQFTSTNGTLDQNIILDEVWWAHWISGDQEEMELGAALDTLGQWEQDTRKIILDTLATWEQDTRKIIINTLKEYIDKKFDEIEAVPDGEVGAGVVLPGLNADEIREIVSTEVRAELDKTKLTA